MVITHTPADIVEEILISLIQSCQDCEERMGVQRGTKVAQ